MMQPARHAPPLQNLPVPQVVPSASVVNDDTDFAGVQVWQAFDGFAPPAAYGLPPMSQPPHACTSWYALTLPRPVA